MFYIQGTCLLLTGLFTGLWGYYIVKKRIRNELLLYSVVSIAYLLAVILW
jgi:hypothetical protein